jgi:hypothetical protein
MLGHESFSQTSTYLNATKMGFGTACAGSTNPPPGCNPVATKATIEPPLDCNDDAAAATNVLVN